jgi:hypothetical protein
MSTAVSCQPESRLRDSSGDDADSSMNHATRQGALYRFDNLTGKRGGRNGALSAVLDGFPLTRCRCLILAANGLSFMVSHE